MRLAFVHTLIELARNDKDIWLVTGDLGFSVFEGFIKEFPNQYLNVGVAEQDMIGIAAGLALVGKKPFVYSISTFATMRPYEQIRNDICYQNLPVVLIGGGSTFSYSTFGCTHFPLEDLALMRVLPHMRVVCPGDPYEVVSLLKDIYKNPGPAYMRIAKKGEPHVHAPETHIALGKSIELRSGPDVALFVSGRLLPVVMQAAELLEQTGIQVSVHSHPTVKPLDSTSILTAAKKSHAILTCEEHSVVAGFGSAVAECLMNNNISIPFKMMGVPDEFPKGVGSQEWFLTRYNLTPQGIADEVRKICSKK